MTEFFVDDCLTIPSKVYLASVNGGRINRIFIPFVGKFLLRHCGMRFRAERSNKYCYYGSMVNRHRAFQPRS